MATERIPFQEEDWQTDPASYDTIPLSDLRNHIASVQADIDADVAKVIELRTQLEQTRVDAEHNRAILATLQQALNLKRDLGQ